VVRRQLLSYDASRASSSPCPTPYSLSFQLAYRFLDAEGKPLTVTENGEWQSDKVVFKPLVARTGGYQGLNGRSTQMLLNYHSNPYPAVKFSIREVLEKRVPGNLIKDKIVLIGYTAAIAKDNFDTPHGNIPGVWIHAHMVSQILSAVIDKRQQIWVLPQLGDLQWGEALWVWSWSFIVGLLICRFTTPAYLILVCGVAIWILQKICLVILTYGGWMPFIPSVLSLMVTGGLVVYTIRHTRQPYI
jgi:CHASE2 domain-containing sensor protein